MKKLKVLALIFLVSAFSFSQSGTINLTFHVDMGVATAEGLFNPQVQSVVVRGNFQADAGDSLGNWQGNMFEMLYNYGTIYSVSFTMPDSFAGNSYEYKFVITPDEIWEIDPNRIFSLNSPSVVVGPYYFNYDSNITIIEEVTNTLNFTADISGILGVGIGGAFDPNQDSLLVMGLDWDNLGKNVVGNRRMLNTDPFNEGIYTTTLTVTSGSAAPNGVGDSTEWKFRAVPDSRFQNTGWEIGLNRQYIYQADGTVVDLPTIVPRIYPNFGTSTNEIDFTLNVDMTDAINWYNGEPIPVDSIDYVVVLGSVPWLGNSWAPHCWCPDDTVNGLLKVLTHTSGNIWSYDTTLPVGINLGPFEFRFGAMYPGADTVNGGIAYLNNEFPFGTNHFSILFDQPISVSNNWFGHLSLPDGVERIENLLPSEYHLEQNYPNPFNPTTKIRYSIPEYSSVTLKVFNLLGEEIETLFNGEQSAGVYEATFDASNLSSGIYFYALQTDNFSSSKKMILIR